MKGFLASGALIALLLVFLAGCASSSGTDGVTISGSLTGNYMYVTDNPVITITKAGSSFPVQVTLSGTDIQSGSYSIPNVPVGDYSIVVTITIPSITISKSQTIDVTLQEVLV